MLTTEQVQRLSGQRKVVAQTRVFKPGEGEDLGLRYAQVGLPFTSEHAAYLTVKLKSMNSLSLFVLQELARELATSAQQEDYDWVVVIAVSCAQWRHWCRQIAKPLDDALFSESVRLEKLLREHSPPYAYSGGELFFHIKACKDGRDAEIAQKILGRLGEAFDPDTVSLVFGDSMHEGRIYGGRMLHGLIGSVDPVCFSARAIVGGEFPDHKGSCFGVTQRFEHDWSQLLGMADSEMERLIGRDHGGNILPDDDDRCHIKRVRVNDENGLNYRLVGESQPYREPDDKMGKEKGIFQVAYAKSFLALACCLEGMVGKEPGQIKSRHLLVSQAKMGSYWYVPSAHELGLAVPQDTLTVPMNAFFDLRSGNGRMFYNTKDYLHHLGNRTENAKSLDPLPTDRVVELLGYTFSRWHDTWYRRRPAPELKHLEDKDYRAFLADGEKDVLAASVAERKGLAVRTTLNLLSQADLGKQFDTYRLHPKELIVGVVPDFTLGSGYEAMRYLNPVEQDEAFVLRLNEAGAAGHVVPNHGYALRWGIGGILDDLRTRMAAAPDEAARQFYQSAIYAFEGVQVYLRHYADLARTLIGKMRNGSQGDRQNLEAIAERMDKLALQPPDSFVEAAQLVFSMHCCLHIAGESVSIGRLDQLLAPYYDPSRVRPEEAQEIIDCFWIKMDEKVLLNHRHFNDRLSRGSGAITYQGGDFPQGAALNQWVQQLTVGGYKANDAEVPEDACNDVTRMCLRAARRLPLNAPCLSLRMHPNMPADIVQEAAQAILAGGAHPLLINDDRIVKGLQASGELTPGGSSIVRLADARDMACDGCFESLIAGKSEFAFSYVPVPDAIEMALNCGRTYAMAGPVHVMGLKTSFRSKPAEQIGTWEEFYAIFFKHYRYKLVEFYDGMLSRYGNLARFCPSPLLSPLIDGCLDRGRDLSASGARYKILAPLMNGISTAIDSLWAIRHMVFSEEAVFTLPELKHALICDWGHDMKEPFYSKAIGEDRIAVAAKRFQNLRLHALNLPKFGQGHDEVDSFGRAVVRDLVGLAYDVIRKPQGSIARKLHDLRQRYGTTEHPFEFVISPGIATFEDYAGVGSFLGASADGRRARETVASDFSPSPSPLDLPIPDRGRDAIQCLKAWAPGPAQGHASHIDPIGVGLSNGSPADINIREQFPEQELVNILWGFARSELGPNMLSITCADPETLVEAQRFPERYDLVRMRMGGWSEFFVAMFPEHQEQHKRRPFFEARGKAASVACTSWRGKVRTACK